MYNSNLIDNRKIENFFITEYKDEYHPLCLRINELLNFFYEENDENEISIKSLKSMLNFLTKKHNLIKPSITLNDDGLFHFTWKKHNKKLITIQFGNDNFFITYVIFHDNKILNGKMTIDDFFNYLIKLQIDNLILK